MLGFETVPRLSRDGLIRKAAILSATIALAGCDLKGGEAPDTPSQSQDQTRQQGPERPANVNAIAEERAEEFARRFLALSKKEGIERRQAKLAIPCGRGPSGEEVCGKPSQRDRERLRRFNQRRLSIARPLDAPRGEEFDNEQSFSVELFSGRVDKNIEASDIKEVSVFVTRTRPTDEIYSFEMQRDKNRGGWRIRAGYLGGEYEDQAFLCYDTRIDRRKGDYLPLSTNTLDQLLQDVDQAIDQAELSQEASIPEPSRGISRLPFEIAEDC